MLTTEKIWADFSEEMLQLIRSKVKDESLAKDLLQDVFIKIHLHRHKLSTDEKLGAWVYRITRNVVTDHYRSHNKSNECVPEEWPEEPETDDLLGQLLSLCVEPFVQELSPEYRDAIVLTDLGKLSQKEYAELKNISYSGAKSRVQRARKQLFEVFESCCQIESDKYGNIIDIKQRPVCLCPIEKIRKNKI